MSTSQVRISEEAFGHVCTIADARDMDKNEAASHLILVGMSRLKALNKYAKAAKKAARAAAGDKPAKVKKAPVAKAPKPKKEKPAKAVKAKKAAKPKKEKAPKAEKPAKAPKVAKEKTAKGPKRARPSAKELLEQRKRAAEAAANEEHSDPASDLDDED